MKTPKTLSKRGVYLKDIAHELGVHPKTVSRALKRGSAPPGPRKRRASKLDPYTAQVDQLLAENVWNAQVILREIQARGYPGGITILREYIAPKRALRPGKATVRFEPEPASSCRATGARSRPRSLGSDDQGTFYSGDLWTIHPVLDSTDPQGTRPTGVRRASSSLHIRYYLSAALHDIVTGSPEAKIFPGPAAVQDVVTIEWDRAAPELSSLGFIKRTPGASFPKRREE